MLMKRKHYIIVSSFLLLLIICIIPTLVHGYIYPNGSEDTVRNMSVIVRMCEGTLPLFEFRFIGYAIIGFPLYYLAKFINVEFYMVFTWFHALLPLMVGSVLYFVISKLVNWRVALFSLVIPVLVSGASMYYIYQGILLNLINVMILYPLLFYFIIKWLIESRLYQLVLVVIFTLLVGTFHTSGLYAPAVLCLSLIVYIIFSKITNRKINKNKVIVCLIIIVIGILCTLAIPYNRFQFMQVLNGIISGNSDLVAEKSQVLQEAYQSLVPTSYYISVFITIPIVILFIVSMWNIKKLKADSKCMLLLCFLFSWAVIVLVVAYLKLSTVPFRQQTDFAIILSMLITVLIGKLACNNRKMLLLTLLIIVMGLYPHFIPAWFQYNSAIKSADKQAIEYVNSLCVETYNCSSQVSYLIYDAYLKAKYDYSEDYADILIMRNEPMTQGNDINSIYYDGHGVSSSDGYSLDKIFSDGEVEVKVYNKTD